MQNKSERDEVIKTLQNSLKKMADISIVDGNISEIMLSIS